MRTLCVVSVISVFYANGQANIDADVDISLLQLRATKHEQADPTYADFQSAEASLLESAASTAKVATLDEQNPAEVTCGQVVPFTIERGGDRYTPTLTGVQGMQVTLSTTVSASHGDTTLSDTRIFGPCENDEYSNLPQFLRLHFYGPHLSECSFHAQTETRTAIVGGYGYESGLAYLEVRCEEYVPPPVQCAEWGVWPQWTAPSCSECPTAPRRDRPPNDNGNGYHNGLCQGDCRWNNPTTHDVCIPVDDGVSGHCPSQCRHSSPDRRGFRDICVVPDSYASRHSMPPGDRVCYHGCMRKPIWEMGHHAYVMECGDSDWYFRSGEVSHNCCGCAPVGFEYGSGSHSCGDVAE